ncbi:ParE toxin of type II toxin-antitoxin system, parDE [uncultured archaeon]|nr:ParE toxin of type II toxin-antitoxin system, parDE [uncultured archaeon]
MPYSIIWSPKSQEGLKRFEAKMQWRIIRKVKELELAPYHFMERMTDITTWKLRIGDYRVILDIDESAKEIHVLKIGHRKNIYK